MQPSRKKIVSETCKKRSQKYLVSESRGEPCACSSHVPIEGHTCCSTLLFKLTLSGSFTYYCVFMLPCVFIMQCILFSYLNSVIVIKHFIPCYMPSLIPIHFLLQDEKEKAYAVAESEIQALTRKLILEQDELEVTTFPGIRIHSSFILKLLTKTLLMIWL